MNHLIKDLLILQELQLHGTGPGCKEERQLKSLRKNVPESLLDIFDRWIYRGKKPVAIVSHGVCSECHLKVATGVLLNLAHEDEIEHCGNCGRILYFVPDDDSTQRHSQSHRTSVAKNEIPARVNSTSAKHANGRMTVAPAR